MGEEISARDVVSDASPKITSLSFLKRLLADLDDRKIKPKSVEEKIDDIIKMIDELPIKNKKLDFIQEQLSLLLKTPKGRRYSNELLAMACMWVHISHALYKQIRLDDVITIPDDKYAMRLSSSLTVDFDLSERTVEYLKLRMAKLHPKDFNINLILDEIYSFATIQYTNGGFYGNEGHAITKTMLCIMIKSVAGGYRDVITMAPITNISSEKIYEIWKNVVKKITELAFNIVATTADNHKSNMKFFTTHLCNGTLRTYIQNPYALERKIHLLFDGTHILKCIYNNFRAKDSFVCPPFDGEGSIKYPSFGHIKELHHLEMGAATKYAHKLSDKVIDPLALEKTNVQHQCLLKALSPDAITTAKRGYQALMIPPSSCR